MAPFYVPPQIRLKIKQKHGVEEEEAKEAFINYTGEFFKEVRAEHSRSYRKIWFISETDHGRLLKVILTEEDDQLVLISAYDPSQEDLDFYENESKKAKRNSRR